MVVDVFDGGGGAAASACGAAVDDAAGAGVVRRCRGRDPCRGVPDGATIDTGRAAGPARA
ncbi:hypothetical protein UK12_27925 [Saccharothrix sp. ST-888]|nr:hypothetical protein UK12_27925 [Saccharothrix sp. ST-888]